MNKFSITVSEAAEYTGVGRNTLRNLIKIDKLPSIMIGTKELIIVKDLERFLTVNRGHNLLDTDELRPLLPQECHQNWGDEKNASY